MCGHRRSTGTLRYFEHLSQVILLWRRQVDRGFGVSRAPGLGSTGVRGSRAELSCLKCRSSTPRWRPLGCTSLEISAMLRTSPACAPLLISDCFRLRSWRQRSMTSSSWRRSPRIGGRSSSRLRDARVLLMWLSVPESLKGQAQEDQDGVRECEGAKKLQLS